MPKITPSIKILLILNIILFIASQFFGELYEYLSLHYFENPNFRIWQIISHMFMHANIMHIGFNMIALYSLGTNLEYIWGPKKFIIFYLVCGLGAVLLNTAIHYYFFQQGLQTLNTNGFPTDYILQTLNNEQFDTRWQQALNQDQFQRFTEAYLTSSIGASGAIYGLLTAFACQFPNAKLFLIFLPMPIAAKYFVPAVLLLDLYLGLTNQAILGSSSAGIAYFAHIGGALTGFLLMWLWRKKVYRQKI